MERSHLSVTIGDYGSPEPFNCSLAAWLTAGRGAVHSGYCAVTPASLSFGFLYPIFCITHTAVRASAGIYFFQSEVD